MTELKSTVLIIEDEENIGNFMSAILKSSGYKPILCSTGQQGIQCAESYCPDDRYYIKYRKMFRCMK